MQAAMKSHLNRVRVVSFSLAVSSFTWAPRLPELKDHLGLSVVQLGQIFMVVGLVGLLTSKLNSWLLLNVGSRKMILLAAPTGLVGNVLVATTNSVAQFLLGLALCSFAIFITNTASITQGNNYKVAYGVDPQANMSAIANIGALVAMLVGAAFLNVIAPAAYIISLSSVASLSLVLGARKMGRVDNHVNGSSSLSSGSKMPWFGKGTETFWVMVLAVFASTTAEFSVSDWGAILARDSFGIAAPYYLLPFVFFQAGVVSARFATDHLGAKHGISKFVRWSTCSAAVVWAISLIVGALVGHSSPSITLVVTLVGFAAGGWGVGPIWPVFISAISEGPFNIAIALPRFFSVVSLAFVLGPGVLGQLANFLTLPYALVVTAFMLFLAGTQARTKVIGGGSVRGEN
jgi:MFS family permease